MKTRRILAYCALCAALIIAVQVFGSDTESIKKQWKASPHAGSMDTPEEKESMNKKGCAKCHLAQGYHEVILAGKESSAPYEDPEGLTCIACHHPFDDKSKPGALRAGSPSNACLGCHNIVVTDSERHFSACPQGFVQQGLGGAEFAGREYPSGAHAGLEKGCVSCHMAPPPDGPGGDLVGGHTHLAVAGEGDDAILNENACDMCHGAISMEVVRRSQEKFRALLEELAGLLPKKPAASEEETRPVPRFPKDPSLSDSEAMASFNYYLIEKDGTYGIHNPAYTRALIEESIAALKAEKNK
jgi:hypothetical protein